MRKIIPMLLTLAAGAAHAAEWHVAVDGKKSNTGSSDSPWSLASALAHPEAVKPGDTIWLHGGVYEGTFKSTLKGTPEAPIVVRQARGERATLQGGFMPKDHILSVAGSCTTYQGFEVATTFGPRIAPKGGTPWGGEPCAVAVGGPSTRLVNLVVHDTGSGINAGPSAVDHEIYGCIIYHNGFDETRRGWGHGITLRNDSGTARVVDNILFNQFSNGIHATAKSPSLTNNLHIEGNTSFNNGACARTGYRYNILLGGDVASKNWTLLDNMTFFSAKGRGENSIGVGKGAADVAIKNNIFVGGTALALGACEGTVSGNRFFGKVSGVPTKDNVCQDTASGLQHVAVRPNRYEPGRANITVYNGEKKEKVAVDLSASGLKKGGRFEIRDVQNFFGEPVVTGTFDGSPVAIPMTGEKVAEPTGDAPVKPPHTGPEFGAFVLLPVGG